MATYCTQADLELAVGGAAVLRDLLDKNNTGSADPNQVTAVLTEATAEVNSAINVAFDITTLVAPYPDALVQWTKRIAAYYAYLQSTSGMAMPENIKESYQAAQQWLDKVAHGDRSLGSTVPPGAEKSMGQVDPNPNVGSTPSNNTTLAQDGGRVTRQTMSGFA